MACRQTSWHASWRAWQVVWEITRESSAGAPLGPLVTYDSLACLVVESRGSVTVARTPQQPTPAENSHYHTTHFILPFAILACTSSNAPDSQAFASPPWGAVPIPCSCPSNPSPSVRRHCAEQTIACDMSPGSQCKRHHHPSSPSSPSGPFRTFIAWPCRPSDDGSLVRQVVSLFVELH